MKAFRKDVRGASAIEYALIAGFVVLGIIANVTTIGHTVGRMIASVSQGLLP